VEIAVIVALIALFETLSATFGTNSRDADDWNIHPSV
jgi:hypothetical protein